MTPLHLRQPIFSREASLRRVYAVVLWLAFIWLVVNCGIVYLVLHGARAYRVESATLILMAVLLPFAVTGREREPSVVLSRVAVASLVGASITAWLFIYVPLLRYPFLSDDFVFLDRYREFARVGETFHFFRPFYALVFWILARLGSESPLIFHICSLGLHLASAFFVFRLACMFFAANGPPTLCFAMFLLNPLQLEAVLWVSGLQELLWSFFVLAALVCYLSRQRLSIERLVGALVLISCALLSKETAVCFLLLFPAADWVLYRSDRGRILWAGYAMFAAQFLAYLALRNYFWRMESGYLIAPSRYLVKQFVSTPYRFFVQPWNAAAVDVPGFIGLLVSVVTAALLVVAALLRRTSPRVLAGPFIVLASTLPVYSYFFVGSDLMASRYLYFAAFGWALLISTAAIAVVPRRSHLAALVVIIVAGYGIALRLNVGPWLVAAQVVQAFAEGGLRREDPGTTLTRWRAQTGIPLQVKGGVPWAYQGVGIFNNGYPEFLRFVARKAEWPMNARE